jgi:D-arabinose 1-dehydrogenase-like Zn-dependent alcohol dehydrogenase
MTDEPNSAPPEQDSYLGVYRDGMIKLSAPINWPDGTVVSVQLAEPRTPPPEQPFGKVIIAGFGLAGRWVADIFERHGIEYVIVDKNRETVEVQSKLGRQVIEGDVSDEETLRKAGIADASILALTVPDEDAVLEATRLARQMKPGIYIVARTAYSSSGLRATQLGADEVIKAEQAVARQFYEMMLRKVGMAPSPPTRQESE